LKGKRVALERDNVVHENFARKIPGAKIVYYDDTLDMFKAVIYGKADATIGVDSIEYTLLKNGLPYLERAYPLEKKIYLKFAIRKDMPEALSILNKGLANISEHERIQLKEKWFFSSQRKNPGELTPEEKRYLFQKKKITYCIDSNFGPFSYLDDGVLKGVAPDIVKMMEKRVGVEFEYIHSDSFEESLKLLERGVCDFIPTFVATDENGLLATRPYSSWNILIVNRADDAIVANRDSLNGKTVSVERHSPLSTYLKEEFPSLKQIETDNDLQSFRYLIEGRSDYTATILPVLDYYMHRYGLERLQVAGYTYSKIDISMVTSKKNGMLLSILDKSISGISHDAINAVVEKWMNSYTETDNNYELAIYILAISSLIVAVILYWLRRISNLNKILQRQKIELARERKKAQEAARVKSEFLANMSHEIKTPINAIMGMSRMASEKCEDESKRRYFDIINENSKRLLLIIDDILELSRLEKRKVELHKVNFDLSKLLDDTIALMRVQAEEKGLEIELRQDPDTRKILYGDSLKLSQILINLLSNSIKFTERGQVSLCVSRLSRNRYSFRVKDSGIGMSVEEKERIFEAFTQAESGIGRKYGGTGLGITISSKFAELMNGTLKVESEKGVGSEFTLEVELEDEREGEEYEEREDRKIKPSVSEAESEDERAKRLPEEGEVREILEELEKALAKGRPIESAQAVAKLDLLSLPEDIAILYPRLKKAVKNYRFKEALEILDRMKER